MSTLHVNKLKAAVGTTVNVESGHVLQAPGHVVQVVQTYDNTNEATYSATAFTNISYLDTTITPKVSGSKFCSLLNPAGNATGPIHGSSPPTEPLAKSWVSMPDSGLA